MKGGKLQQVVRAEELQRVGGTAESRGPHEDPGAGATGGSREENLEAKGAVSPPSYLG